MKKFYLFFIVGCLLANQSFSQFTDLQWKKLYDTASVRLVENFPIYFFGSNKLIKLPGNEALFASDFNNDIGLWKVDAQGNTLWRKTFGGAGIERVNAVRQAADGGFVITGSSTSSDGLFANAHGSQDGFVAKTDQTGNVQWVRLIGGSSIDMFTNIEVTSDGYIAIGHTQSSNGDILVNNGASDILVTRLDLDGTAIWTKTFGGANCERALTSLVNKSEDVIIGGLFTTSSICDFGSPIKKLLVGVDKNGVQLWQNESITMPANELGSITNLTFNADSSQVYSIVKKTVNQQSWLYKFNPVTGAAISSTQLNLNISTDYGATSIHRKSNNNYLVPIASPVYQTDVLAPRYTYLAEITDAGTVVSLNQFDFNSGIITDVIERGSELLFFTAQSHPSLPLHVQLGVYNPNPAPPGPEITSFSPAAASIYSIITIKGKGFTGATAVSFGGVPAYSFSVLSDSIVEAINGAGATGEVVVTSPQGIATKSGFTFIEAHRPIGMTSFSPATASFFHTVVIKGYGFTGAYEVRFGGYYAYSFTVIDDSTISAKVGRGGASDEIYVSTKFGSAHLGGFTYVQPLLISSFSPAYGPVGTNVRLEGGHFSAVAAENHVYFGETPATVVEADSSYLVVTVPAGATSGNIVVTVDTISSYTRDLFMVIQPGEDDVKSFAFDVRPRLSASNIAIRSFAAGDFNEDGISDLAVVSKGAAVLSVFKSASYLDTVAFEPGMNFTLPGSPMDVITDDVDKDGKVDILVKTNQQSFISIFRNTSSNGNISFASRIDIAVSSYPSNQFHSHLLATSDLDGDNLPELITDNPETNTFSVYRNTGSAGVIQYAPKIDFPYYPYSIVVRDFNGDNKPDLALLSAGNYFVIFKNTSTAGSISLVKSAGGELANGTIFGLASSDYDGDGKQDLAAIVTERTLTIYRNTSVADSITFAPKADWQLAYYPTYINSGDFDGDGKSDILIGNNSTTTFSVLGNISSPGNLAFAFKKDFATGTNAAESVVADINNDGKPDIATIAEDDGRIFIARNRLHEPVIHSFSPAFGAAGDTIVIKGLDLTITTAVQFGGVTAASFVVESDSIIKAVVGAGATGSVAVINAYGTARKNGFIFGRAPIIISFTPSSGPAGTVVTISGKHFGANVSENIVYFGGGKATVTHATDSTLTVVAPATSTYQPITVTSNEKTAFSELPYTLTFVGGGGINYQSFLPDTSFGAISRPRQIAIADLDLDGKSDLVVSFNSYLNRAFVSVIRNRSIPDSTAFGQRIDYPTPGIPSCVALEDLDGDGKKDMVVGSSGGEKVFVYRNITDTYWIDFADRQEYVVGLQPSSIALNDLNGDGRPEIIVTNDQDGSFSVLLNTGSKGYISFAEKKTWPLGFWPRIIGVRDFDGDSKSDIVSVGIPGYLFVLRNTSTADSLSFNDTINIFVPGMVNALGFGDIDGDNRTDVVLGRVGSNAIGVLRNISDSGSIVFATPVYAQGSAVVQSIDIGDMNGDGKPDVVFTKATGSFAVLENNSSAGNIAFQAVDSFMVGESLYYASIGDLDGDGKPDIVAGDDSVRIRIIKNRMAQALVTPSGANPVSGGMTNKVIIDSTVQAYQGHPYVQRHYDITPVNNPATVTATLTLYFTQQEFDNYNAHPAHGLDLPHHATDDFNKANLRVYQYHGFSTTSLPGSYSGNGIEIDPDDTKIVWNVTTLQWEVTFDVNGFSGFFIGTAGNSILPVTILSFEGRVKDNVARLQWTTTREINVSHFELQRRDNSSEFVTIGKINASSGSNLEYDYYYSDELGGSPVYYYRLKIVDTDQSVTYSKTVILRPDAVKALITFGPNPAKDFVVVKHPATRNAVQLRVVDVSGKVIKAVSVGNNTSQTKIMLTGVPRGTYTIVWDEGASSISRVLIVQ